MAEELKPYPNEYLEDYWKTLWHVDVFKDQESTYDKDIVNGYLYDNKYKTTQSYKKGEKTITISDKDKEASRYGGTDKGYLLGKEELFEYLTGQDFNAFSKLPVGTKLDITLNEKLMGETVRYQIEIFNEKGQNTDGNITLPNFVGNPIALYVDTTSHLPDLLLNYIKGGINQPIIYAYSREIQSDPAEKTTFESIDKAEITATEKSSKEDLKKKLKDTFYYEPAEKFSNNPETIVYSPYKIDDGLSYFYCKYPVFLINRGIDNEKKKTLKVELSYSKGDKVIVVPEGANTAGAFNKIGVCLKKVLGVKDDAEKKEMMFISKHHGDVAQSLVKFRDIEMAKSIPPMDTEKINTSNYKATFVSIDLNAIIKALTVGVPFVFMYPPAQFRDKATGGKMIVWKNNSLNDPNQQFDTEKKYTLDQNKRVQTGIEIYNGRITDINDNLDKYKTKVEAVLVDKEFEGITLESLPDFAKQYGEILKFGFRISTLSKFLPKGTLSKLTAATYNKQTEIDNIKIEDGDTDEILKTKINQLKTIQVQLSAIEKTFSEIPSTYTKILTMNGETLETVSIEKDMVLRFEVEQIKTAAKARLPGKIYFQTHRKDERITELWNMTDLSFNWGDYSIDSLLCRFGTKLNNSWGFDMIYTIYSSLKEYNEEYANKFISKLEALIAKIPESIQPKPLDKKPKKIETFKFGLLLINIDIIPGGAGVPVVGGNRKIRRRLGGSETMVLTKPVEEVNDNRPKTITLQLKSEESENIFFKGLKIELSDIINHLKFMKTLYYLQFYSNRLSKAQFELYGLMIYDKFFKSVFGPNYGVLPKEFRVREVGIRKIIGGDKDDNFTEKIIDLVKNAKLNSYKRYENLIAEEETYEKLENFNKDAKFLSTYSVIPYYEYIANTLEQRLSTLESKTRKSDNVKISIEYTKAQIKNISDLISEIRELDNLEFEDETENTLTNGGRRLRKFKTYKKNKKPMKKTLKKRRN